MVGGGICEHLQTPHTILTIGLAKKLYHPVSYCKLRTFSCQVFEAELIAKFEGDDFYFILKNIYALSIASTIKHGIVFIYWAYSPITLNVPHDFWMSNLHNKPCHQVVFV